MKASTANVKGSQTLPDVRTGCEAMNGQATKAKLPKLGKHSSGQARACFGGRMEYFGPWGSPEALAAYAARCREWLDNGGKATVRTPHAGQMLSVAELLKRYREGIDGSGCYRKHGAATSQREIIEHALTSFAQHVGNMRAADLRESVLLGWRDTLERQTAPRLVRNGVNRKVALVLLAIKWGKARGIVTRDAWADCSALEPLKRGTCGDRPEKGRQRRAISLEDAEKVAAASPCRHVAAMIRIQSLVGMRPGEVCGMRWCDIDRNGPIADGVQFWTYRVAGSKTEHHGRSVSYPIPPAAQAILAEFPGVGAAFVFSPRASMRERGYERDCGDGWRERSYRNAVTQAAKAAGVDYFSPHELRHGSLTRVAEACGALAAQVLAGHANIATTNRYLHADNALALRAVMAAGRRLG